MEKVFSHAWRGRHGNEGEEELKQLTERQTTPEDIQQQYIDDDQVIIITIIKFQTVFGQLRTTL